MSRRAAILAGLMSLAVGVPALALDLQLPANARLTVERDSTLDSFAAPVGVFAEGGVPVRVIEGPVSRQAWRIDTGALTTLQVMAPLRAQIEAAGYDIVFECTARTCGGFDFRFAVETLPGPNMYVNIRAYRYLTASRGPVDTPQEVITVLASASASSAYVQIIRAGPTGGDTIARGTSPPPASSRSGPPATADDLPGILLSQGHAVLRDLEFDSGSATLGPGPFASLAVLAGFLNTRPELRLALVGHTDTVGGLDPNIVLSRRRAQSVRDRLIDVHGVPADRLDAEGMGYLSPVATNLDAAGRDQNRRVEAVLLSAE